MTDLHIQESPDGSSARTTTTDLRSSAEAVARWLSRNVVAAARGEGENELHVQPSGRYFLGRVAPEARIAKTEWGDRADRLEPCAVGLRVRPSGGAPWCVRAHVAARAWTRRDSSANAAWCKTRRITGVVTALVQPDEGASQRFDFEDFRKEMAAEIGVEAYSLQLVAEYERATTGEAELTILAVNATPDDDRVVDSVLYEIELEVEDLPSLPFVLEALPDSFRHDRRVAAYGVNCAAEALPKNAFRVADTCEVERSRPAFWATTTPEPDVSFATLASNPLPSLATLVAAHRAWGEQVWSQAELARRQEVERWTASMRQEAEGSARDYRDETARLAAGVQLLSERSDLLRAFTLMNAAMLRASRHGRWRPFQVGFILSSLSCFVDEADSEIVDVLWFPTGGGKTETYLGLLILGAFFDRLSGKRTGVSAWSRFPLRLLSLQQTQRFADALAGAEIIRREEKIGGAPFSLGFFVGENGTPNRIRLEPRDGDPDPDDEGMPKRYQVLLYCPFCRGGIEMGFDRATWRLEHRCASSACPWPERGLPFYIVDDEIYRFLPTVVVGTLDKVAVIGMQSASRGLLAAPLGICSEDRHGYVYAPRSDFPNGCLVPQCSGSRKSLPIPAGLYTPRFRLQDELHLLRDSLGAVDAFYESLLDALAAEATQHRSKVVASSATLSGYDRQVAVLYRRRARVFPVLGPSAGLSFWATDGESLLRRFVAVAPQGVTLEYAADRVITLLQQAIRNLLTRPDQVAAEIGIAPAVVAEMASLFGTNVVYGNTIRDLDATARSLETQVPVDPLNTAQLTGHTLFTDVRSILERLEKPEADFNARIHVITASQMMSHGVDIDRLNTMVMLGAPLGTAEFIQATSRIGRTWPGVVIMLHKMARERDASIYRSFRQFVTQGDRFVEPIPITRRSRRVLRKALPGIVEARRLHVHEPASGDRLTTVRTFRKYVQDRRIRAEDETTWIAAMLGYDGALDARLRRELEECMQVFFRNLLDPAGTAKFPSDLWPDGRPMLSLRDVEEQASVWD